MENKSSVNTKQEPIVRGSWTKLSRRLLEKRFNKGLCVATWAKPNSN